MRTPAEVAMKKRYEFAETRSCESEVITPPNAQ